MSPVRHVSSPRALTQTSPGERPPGAWRYSSHLALVLGGGGARGAYQVGVLAGLAERLPGLAFPIIAGTSVGAINTVYLAAHLGALGEAVAGLRDAWAGLTSEGVFRLRLFGLIACLARKGLASVTGLGGGGGAGGVRGLADTTPLREFLARGANLRGLTATLAT